MKKQVKNILERKFSKFNKYSSEITQPKSQGASQAMLYATGLNENDMSKGQVGIVSNWFEVNWIFYIRGIHAICI